jgi:hypothetical protein
VIPERTDPVRRDRLVIALAYTLAWGALLVNRGLYWDDWTLVGVTPGSLIQQFSELGMPWAGVFNAAVLGLPLPGLVGHAIAFGTYLLSTLLVHAVMRRVPGLSRLDALVAAITFAVLPVNYARIALIDLVYGVSLLAFLAATWLLLRHLEEDGRWRRVAALVLFVASFSTASLLVMYIAPVALAAVILARSGRLNVRSVLGYADFLAIPMVYWLVKSVLFKPGGVYEGYNALTLSGIARVPGLLIDIPYQVLAEPLARASSVAGLAGLAGGVVAAVWLLRRTWTDEQTPLLPAPAVALLGAALLGLGVFAYLAVGRIPTIWDWSSRHQLLVPIGAGLLAAAVVRGARGAGRIGPVFGIAIGLLVGISVVADARTLIAYQLDWFKQSALTDAARTIPELRTARHIEIVDSATALNALRRTYRFYEYNALFSVALGDTRRLAVERGKEPDAEALPDFISHPAYHMGEYVPTPVDLELRLSMGEHTPGVLQILRLVMLEALGPAGFDAEVARLIDVQARPVGGSAPAP